MHCLEVFLQQSFILWRVLRYNVPSFHAVIDIKKISAKDYGK